MKDVDIKQLLKESSPEDSIRLKILYNAVVQNMRTYSQDPTEVNRRNWDAAEKALMDEKGRLEMALDDAQGFETQKEVLAHLHQLGYKISRSRLSRDIQARKLRKKDGIFSVGKIKRYAELELVETDSGKGLSDRRAEKLQERKIRAEIKKLEEQALRAKIEREAIEGRYIERVDHELHMALAASVLESGLKYFYSLRAQEIIDLVGGSPARAGDLTAYLKQQLDKQLAIFARSRKYEIEVINEPEKENESH